MTSFSVELPDNLAQQLDAICLGSPVIRQELLKELLVQYLEDTRDATDAALVIARGEPTTSLASLRSELGLHH